MRTKRISRQKRNNEVPSTPPQAQFFFQRRDWIFKALTGYNKCGSGGMLKKAQGEIRETDNFWEEGQ